MKHLKDTFCDAPLLRKTILYHFSFFISSIIQNVISVSFKCHFSVSGNSEDFNPELVFWKQTSLLIVF